MSLLALDLATLCGWAMLHDDDSVDSGVWDLSPDKGQHEGWRFTHLRRRLAMIEGLELVAFERTQHMSGNAIAVHGGLTAIVQEHCAPRSIPCVTVHNATLKKHITGSGRADKAEVQRAVACVFPEQVITSFDQSDALAVLAWCIDTDQIGKGAA